MSAREVDRGGAMRKLATGLGALVITSAATLVTLALPGGNGAALPLFPVMKGGLWGYIDAEGRVVIPPRFRHARPFNDGVAQVLIGNDAHFVDMTGRVLFRSPFDNYDEVTFSEGLAGGRTAGAFRYVDKAGRFVGDTYFSGGPCREGLMPIAVDVRPPAERRPVRNYHHLRWGFIDRHGHQVIPPQFTAAMPFYEGRAAVYVGGGNFECTGLGGGKWGFINRRGQLVIEARYEYAAEFSEGLAAVGDRRMKGYIDASGTYVIPPRPLYIAGPFREGLAYAKSVDKARGTYGDVYYLDRAGTIVLPPDRRFDIGNFCGGLAVARVDYDGKRGFINPRGEWVVPPVFDHISEFRDGVAYVGAGDEFGYIDRQGRFIWPLSK